MKTKTITFIFALTASINILSARAKGDDLLRMYQVDPLQKIFKESTYLIDDVDTIRVARGGYASIQIVIKGLEDLTDIEVHVKNIQNEGKSTLKEASAGWVGYVRLGRTYSNPSSERLYSTSGYFPDPILTDSLFSLASGEIQPLWITVPIDSDAEPGLYQGSVEVNGKHKKKNFRSEKTFFIRVYPITLGKSPFFFSNWSAHFSPVTLSYLNGGKKVDFYSQDYWDLIELHAKVMVEHRQNVFRVFPVWHTLYTFNDGKYTFDFSRFDHEVEIYESLGALTLIEGGHLAWRSGNWQSDFYVETPIPDDDGSRSLPAGVCPQKVENGLRFVKLPLSDERAKNFLRQFLPALKEHLRQKGWLDKYVQHIGDEPIESNAESYVDICHFVHEHMDSVRLIDAVMTSKELEGSVDISVPILSTLHRDWDFYQEKKKEGEEIWFYVCTNPRGNYANRFIELPLLQVRYLHWINFKYDLPGFLHWGLNFWDGPDALNSSASRDRGKLPAGDHCVVYPGYRKLYTSIRFETERDGIDDYQLLRMLQDKDPAAARSIVDSIILGFNSYDGSISFFREAHKKLLEKLSNLYQ